MIDKIKKFFVDPEIRFSYFTELGLTRWMSDEQFLKKKYYLAMGKPLNLDNPQTFNEKLQWLKIHDRKPEYTTMVDKYAVKQYVADEIGSQYIIPTLGVWDHFDDIDFDALPDQFVLKCTHDSGGLVICKDKSKLDKKSAKKKIERCLRRNYYYVHREWPYKDVKPRIIAEKYMTNGSGEDLNDYKQMRVNGKVKATFACSSRFSKDGLNVTFYDTDWKRMPFERYTHTADKAEIDRLLTYDEMVALSEKLAQKIPFVRADFHEISEKKYFGELTFSPESRFEGLRPEEWDETLGEWIELPEASEGYLICNAGYLLWLHGSDMQMSESLTDYKFFCFNGTVDNVMLCIDRDTGDTKFYFFSPDWKLLRINRRGKAAPSDFTLPKPRCMDEMIDLAQKLSKGLSFARIDLYQSGGQVYFGEITFFPDSGFDPNILPETDLAWGKRLVHT